MQRFALLTVSSFLHPKLIPLQAQWELSTWMNIMSQKSNKWKEKGERLNLKGMKNIFPCLRMWTLPVFPELNIIEQKKTALWWLLISLFSLFPLNSGWEFSFPISFIMCWGLYFCFCLARVLWKEGLLQIASLFFIPTSINDKVTISPYTAACSDQSWMTCTTTYGL